MGPFHNSEESGGVVQIDTGMDAASGHRSELHRLARLPNSAPRQCLPKRVFYDCRQRLTCVMGEALGRFQELVIEPNSRTHAPKHIGQASICQPGIESHLQLQLLLAIGLTMSGGGTTRPR
ncbi:MAG: hypothetical protein OEV17_08380 [Nitrospira sp.]|nr:hypothetical protein [Nitrospira sp.]